MQMLCSPGRHNNGEASQVGEPPPKRQSSVCICLPRIKYEMRNTPKLIEIFCQSTTPSECISLTIKNFPLMVEFLLDKRREWALNFGSCTRNRTNLPLPLSLCQFMFAKPVSDKSCSLLLRFFLPPPPRIAKSNFHFRNTARRRRRDGHISRRLAMAGVFRGPAWLTNPHDDAPPEEENRHFFAHISFPYINSRWPKTRHPFQDQHLPQPQVCPRGATAVRPFSVTY